MPAHQVPHYIVRAGRPLEGGGFAQVFNRGRPDRRAAMALAAALPDDSNHDVVTVTEYLGYDQRAGRHISRVIARREAGAWATDAALTATARAS